MARSVEVRHLRAFVAVAEELNFSRAAERLHLAQQSLSAQIRQLEKELHVSLLVRTTRSVEVTEAGAVFLEYAYKILAQVELAIEETARVAQGQGVQVGLSVTSTLSNVLPALMQEFDVECPDITLQIHEMWQAESLEAIRAGRVQIAIARMPVLDDSFDSFPLVEEELGVVLGVNHPQFDGEVVDIDALEDSTLVLWPREFSPLYYDRVVDFYRDAGFRGSVQVLQRMTADSFLRDPDALAIMAEGRAFTVAFATEVWLTRVDYAWRPTSPSLRVGVDMYWRRGSGRAVERLVAAARTVSDAQRWRALD